MPGKRSPNVKQVNLRLTIDLHKRLEAAAAEKVGRSLNAEINTRIQQPFRRESADEILEGAQEHL